MQPTNELSESMFSSLKKIQLTDEDHQRWPLFIDKCRFENDPSLSCVGQVKISFVTVLENYSFVHQKG